MGQLKSLALLIRIRMATEKKRPAPKRSTTRKVPAKGTRRLAGESKKPQNRRNFIKKEAAILFAEYGYSAATMDQLSEQTQLNKGTIYYYYKSKADILFDLCIQSTAAKTVSLIEPALKMEYAKDGIEHIVNVVVNWVVEYRTEVQVYFQEVSHFKRIFDAKQYEFTHNLQTEMTNTVIQLIKKGIKSGEFRADDSKVTSRFIISILLWLYQWPEDNLDVKKVSKQATTFILNALEAR